MTEYTETNDPNFDVDNNTPEMCELKESLRNGIIPEDWSHFTPAMTQLCVDVLRDAGLMSKKGIPVPTPGIREKFLQMHKDGMGIKNS